MTDSLKSGGQILVEALEVHGAKHAFCVPGESYLAVLDALYDSSIETTVCRQEGGAAMMADAYGRITGEPGICFVTRGPGATNASAGVHIAQQDSTPMILFIGQVGRSMVDREAFQEIDYRRMYGQLAKWVAQIDDASRIPEYLSRAYYTATSGRPGPVVLALPEDMLRDRVEVRDYQPYQRVEAHPGAQDMAALADKLSAAERPLVITGGGGWTEQAVRDLQNFAEAWDLPISVSFRCADRMDNRHANYAGDVGIGINPALAQRVKDSDCLVVLGARLGEMTSGGYSLFDIPKPKQPMIHIYPGAEELGRVYQPDLAIHAGMPAACAALAALPAPKSAPWSDQTRQARADYEAWTTPPQVAGPVQMGEIIGWLRERLPEDTFMCNGAGNYSAWPNRFYRYPVYPSQLAPTSGSMGYSVPSAVAAKRICPDRPVVAFAGDGCFLMHGQEMATAAQYGLPVIVIVVNNGMYGTIRAHQERDYPGRVSGTHLDNPNFAKLGEAYGGLGFQVTKTEELITPNTTISAIREAALKKKA